MTVRELLDRMDSREFTYWIAYSQIEPWGDVRADFRNGIVAAAVVNGNPWRKKGAEPARATDFMPDFTGEGKRRETPSQKAGRIRNTMACWAAVLTARPSRLTPAGGEGPNLITPQS